MSPRDERMCRGCGLFYDAATASGPCQCGTARSAGTDTPEPSGEVVERVARALWDSEPVVGWSWEMAPEVHKPKYRAMARAALAAAPTPEATAEGYESAWADPRHVAASFPEMSPEAAEAVSAMIRETEHRLAAAVSGGDAQPTPEAPAREVLAEGVVYRNGHHEQEVRWDDVSAYMRIKPGTRVRLVSGEDPHGDERGGR